MPPISRKTRAISVSRPARVFVDGGASIGISVMFGLSNIDGGNSARKAVVGSPHQRADEAERKAQGEASALISTVRKAPQPSAGKQGTSTRRLRPERPTVRRLLSHSTAFRRRFDKGGHRRIAKPFDPQRVVGAVLVDLADEAVEPQPPHKIALREADRVVFRRSHRAGVMVLPAAVLSSPV